MRVFAEEAGLLADQTLVAVEVRVVSLVPRVLFSGLTAVMLSSYSLKGGLIQTDIMFHRTYFFFYIN